ncbi:MAG TPA: hypothetical protein VMC79_04330, partial [Rectinemataceae bacterium]|nr:hypothetical protein [Rectinemataceae bacterium]
MSVVFRSTGAHIPERRITNDELASMVDTTDEWIRSHTGIGARHVAADGHETSDLAADAARKALKKAAIEPRDIDFIVVATATPDYLGFPSTACIVQDKIGANGCAAFDVTAGCTGFIYALDVAANMLEGKKGKHALVIGAETLTRVTDWTDRSTCVLFGDGAGAAVLSRIDEPGRGVLKSLLGAEGGSRAEVIGRSSLPGDLDIWVNLGDRECLVEGLRRRGEVSNLEAEFRKKDGSTGIGL